MSMDVFAWLLELRARTPVESLGISCIFMSLIWEIGSENGYLNLFKEKSLEREWRLREGKELSLWVQTPGEGRGVVQEAEGCKH